MARGIPLLPQHEIFCECIFVRAHALLMQYSTALEWAKRALTKYLIQLLFRPDQFNLLGHGSGGCKFPENKNKK